MGVSSFVEEGVRWGDGAVSAGVVDKGAESGVREDWEKEDEEEALEMLDSADAVGWMVRAASFDVGGSSCVSAVEVVELLA